MGIKDWFRRGGSGGEKRAGEFLQDLAQTAAEGTGSAPTESLAGLEEHARGLLSHPDRVRAPLPPPLRQHWEEVQSRLLRRYPEADQLALYWMTHLPELETYIETLQGNGAAAAAAPTAPPHSRPDPGETLGYLLALWLLTRPVSGAVPAMAAHLAAFLPEPVGDSACIAAYRARRGLARNVTDCLLPLLDRLAGPDSFPHLHRLLLQAVESIRVYWSTTGQPGYALTFGTPAAVAETMARYYTPTLLDAGLLTQADLKQVLLTWPWLLSWLTPRGPWRPGGLRSQSDQNAAEAQRQDQRLSQVQAVTAEFLTRASHDEAGPEERKALLIYTHYQGMDHFLTACRYLGHHPRAKLPLGDPLDPSDPLAWVVHLLRSLPPPAAADHRRAEELATIQPAVLQTAALLNPTWAPLAEPHLNWPGLAALAQWLRRHSGPPPWSEAARWQSSDEDSEGRAGIDRETALAAVAAMGEKRLRALLRHRVARQLYRDGLYYLQAILGWNAAEVEAGFLKRNKRAVRALGLLPDEGDILDRYLALRRFAKEARQFGAQRQASERLAAEAGIANLAMTAGYEEPAQLEWAMEAQLAQDLNPDNSWTLGPYTVTVMTDTAATLVVEKEGRRLKSVPAAVRRAPEYDAIKAAREALQEQWERVRRRLEWAMTTGEVMDRERFAPALQTPAGRAMVPQLVLRCWSGGADAPMELLDFRTLDGQPVPVAGIERFQVAHPLHLAAAGTLQRWQRRLTAAGLTQPFNQLFRPFYSPTPAEKQQKATQRLAGRQVRLGTLKSQLQRRGWQTGSEGDMSRRLTGGWAAALWFRDGAAYMEATETLTLEMLGFVTMGAWRPTEELPPLDPLVFSEALYEADLASTAALADRASAPRSPEVMAARAALAQALVPAAAVQENQATVAGHTLRLDTGAVHGPDGSPVSLPDLSLPQPFPFPDPDPETGRVMARLLYLAQDHPSPPAEE